MTLTYVVTITFGRGFEVKHGHNPKDKKVGTCHANKAFCTDSTGAHHSLIVAASDSEDAVNRVYKELEDETEWFRVTRVERAEILYSPAGEDGMV